MSYLTSSSALRLCVFFCRGQALFSPEQVLPTPRSCVKSHLNDKPTCCLPLRPQSRHSNLWYFGAQLLSLQPCCLRLAHYITVTHSRLASNAVVSSLFDRISTCRIARPSLDARSGTNVVFSSVWHAGLP